MPFGSMRYVKLWWGLGLVAELAKSSVGRQISSRSLGDFSDTLLSKRLLRRCGTDGCKLDATDIGNHSAILQPSRALADRFDDEAVV